MEIFGTQAQAPDDRLVLLPLAIPFPTANPVHETDGLNDGERPADLILAEAERCDLAQGPAM